MSERICAAQSQAYISLKNTYANRDKAVEHIKAGGKKCVWMFGDDVPEEIILAAGMFPVRLIGEYDSCPNADKYLELSFGPLWRAYFEKLINGSCEHLMDYLVLSNSSDIIQKLYYYLLQLGRLEPERKMPPIHYVDYSLMVKDFSAQERNVRETRDFISAMEVWSGNCIATENLRDAIAQCNAHKAALNEISCLRREGRILGSEALNIIGGSFFLEKAEAISLLTELAKEAAHWPIADCVPVAYTGSLHETPAFYKLMEECGLNAVADDKLIGDRYADRNTDTHLDPAIAISQRYHLRFPSSERGFVAERALCIPKLCEDCHAKALLVFMNRNDESYIWDYPKQKKVLDKLKIDSIVIEKQDYPLLNEEMLKAQLKTFADRLKER